MAVREDSSLHGPTRSVPHRAAGIGLVLLTAGLVLAAAVLRLAAVADAIVLPLLAAALAAAAWLALHLARAGAGETPGARLAVTVDAVDQGLILVDRHGRVTLSNRRAAELLDLPEALMAARPDYAQVQARMRRAPRWGVPDDAGALEWHLDDGRRSTFLRQERRGSDGTVLEIRTVPLADGSVLRSFADITHLKRAEEAAQAAERAARESEARYKALADALPQLVWISDPETGETVYANRGFETYYGPLARGAGPGETGTAEARLGLGHVDDIGRMAQAWEAARAEGRPCEVHGRLRRHDGSYRWHKVVMMPLRAEEADREGADGEGPGPRPVTGWLGTALDIDAIVSTRRALEETGTLLRIAQEAAEAGLWDLDLTSFDVLFSPESARLHGLPADRPALMKLDDWIGLAAPEDRDAVLERMREAITSCRTVDMAFRLGPAAAGGAGAAPGPRWLQAIGRTYQDEAGAAARMIGLVFDITARKAAERELVEAKAAAEAASAAKTDFLAAMSHEIRTPLNAVIGFTDLLAESGRLPADLQRHAEHARSAGGALLTVVDDILDFSKVEAGKIELEQAPFALAALVEGCLSIVRGAAAGKALRITADTDPRLPAVLVGDQPRLRQILLNLLNNAVKFTPAGAVTLSVASEGTGPAGARIRFAVTDTGIGIPRDKQHRLFERFSQVDGSIRRDFGGTGLGLAICSRLVAVMGGEIGLVSDEGRGASFAFALTLPDGTLSAKAVQDPHPRAPRERARLLLAEDSDLNRDLARLVLEAAGYQVDTVVDGAGAVRAVETGAYDLVLMDVQMPGMDGMTATRLIRALPAPRGALPVVAMTANVLPAEVARFREAGMDDHIGKPFDRGALYALIDRLLAADGRDGTAAPAAQDRFDRVAFDALAEVVGSIGAARLLERFRALLDGRFAGPARTEADRAHARREAHAVVSPAAMLGFMALAEACTALDTAPDEADLVPLLDRARALAASAARASERLGTGLPAGPAIGQGGDQVARVARDAA